jgi:hypothetical protein
MKWPTSFLSIGFEDPSGPRGHTVPVFYCFLGWSVETHGAIVDTHRGDEPRATSTGMFKTSGAERWLRGRTMLVVAVRGATIRTVLAPRRRCCCCCCSSGLLLRGRDDHERTGGALALVQYATCPRGKYACGLQSNQPSEGGGALTQYTEQCLQAAAQRYGSPW